jgi:hypothetical protein
MDDEERLWWMIGPLRSSCGTPASSRGGARPESAARRNPRSEAALRAREKLRGGAARRLAAGTEGPVEEARGARDVGRSPEASTRAASGVAGGGHELGLERNRKAADEYDK